MPERVLPEQLDQAIESVFAGTEPAADGGRKMAALTEIVSALRDLPSADFKNRLKTELQRRAAMTTSTSTVAGIGAGFRTITPFLIHARRPSWSTS